jgi:hypothetical protein
MIVAAAAPSARHAALVPNSGITPFHGLLDHRSVLSWPPIEGAPPTPDPRAPKLGFRGRPKKPKRKPARQRQILELLKLGFRVGPKAET